MAIKYRNEKMIKIGGAEMEGSLIGGLNQLAYNLTKGKMPSMFEAILIIFICQADKKYSKEEINQFCQAEGMTIITPVLQFIAQITAGDKAAADYSEEQIKKN
jgi:ATP-dependent RNA circularization protein (DNA/RNA ligase family)